MHKLKDGQQQLASASLLNSFNKAFFEDVMNYVTEEEKQKQDVQNTTNLNIQETLNQLNFERNQKGEEQIVNPKQENESISYWHKHDLKEKGKLMKKSMS